MANYKNNENLEESKDDYKPKQGKRGKKFGKAKGGKFGTGRSIPIEKYNDVTWYTKNEQMLKDAASLSFSNRLGQIYDTLDLMPAEVKTLANKALTAEPNLLGKDMSLKHAVPGLMAIRTAPTIGVSNSSTSPANLAAQNIYSFVRYKNSGAKNYDQADLMLYLLAMDSIYSFWNYLKRAYGLMAQYSQYNRYMPESYFKACGLDFESFRDNIADFRLALNRMAAQIGSFAVPGVMTYFVRHSWLYSNVYADSDLMKAQQYMFVPHFFYKYSEMSSQYGGELVAKMVPLFSDTPWTWKDAIGALQELLDAIAYSEDVGVMSGDIEKAYGTNALIKLSSVDADYTVKPAYVEEVLNQIHNLQIVPNMYTGLSNKWKITQNPDTGYLVWDPPISNTYITNKYMLDMPWNDVTPANVMVGTRLTAAILGRADGTARLVCGSEIVVGIQILIWYTKDNKDTLGNMIFNDQSWRNVMIVGSDWGDSVLYLLAISNFDWHPIFRLINIENYSFTIEAQGGGTIQKERKRIGLGLYGDISNYTTVQGEQLENMHMTAIMSEFNIPQIGNF